MKPRALTTLLVTAFTLLSLTQLKAQWVTIPDTAFVSWLNNNGYAACMNGNQMDTTCNLVVNSIQVNVSYRQIRDITGIQYFDNLKWFYCEGNKLTSLPLLPNGVNTINLFDNKLTALPPLPLNLERLTVNFNPLNQLPPLPNTLKYLAVGRNGKNILPTALPDSLEILFTSDDSVTALPQLPNRLKFLTCTGNSLTSLPTLPNSLVWLHCTNNKLSYLPALPDSLVKIECYDNRLAYLPTLPIHIDYLDCSQNPLLQLPSLPSKLRSLYCKNTYIAHVPELPDSLYWCDLSSNPNLACLSWLSKIENLNFSNTSINCVPNYGNVKNSSPQLTSLPLCVQGNLNGCKVYWQVGGRVFYDSNTNCQQELGDTGVGNIKFSFYKSGSLLQQVQSNVNGFYAFEIADTGNYEIIADTTGHPFVVACPVNGKYTALVDSLATFDTTRNFSLTCKPGFDLTAHSVASVGVFRPAAYTTVDVSAGDYSNFFNGRCATGISGTVTLTINGPAVYLSSPNGALPPTVAGNVLTWNVADFGTTNLFTSFDVIVQTDIFAPMGSQVCFTLAVSTTATGDNNPYNDTLTICSIVGNSYDPNDKAAYPAGNIDTTVDWLTYTVRFQNTGTAEAIHINITDTLDSDLDPASFQLLAYSHQPEVQLVGNAIKFNFPYINLPDSNTNEPESHGYVQYKVKLKENRPIGTQIDNTAFIYFDFNPPVITNTTTNTIALISSLANVTAGEGFTFNLYPNPANQSITIHTVQTSGAITIADVTGREAIAANIQSAYTQLNIQQLPKGIYFVTVTDANGGKATKRLVKQ